MRIHVDLKRCTGLGMCESLAPEYFEVQDSGTVVLLQAEFPAAELPLMREAVDACPTCALSLED